MQPPPTALIYAQDKLAMRAQARRARRAGAGVRRGRPGPRTSSTSAPTRLADRDQGASAADTTGAACGSSTTRRSRAHRHRQLDQGVAADRRGEGRRCGVSCPRWSRGRRSGRAPRGPSWRRCSGTGSAPWSSPPPPPARLGRRGRRAAGAPHRRRTRCGRRDGGGAVRDRPTARCVVNELAMRPHNSGHWTHGRCAHLPVRAASARGARLPARRHRAARADHGDGERARRADGPPR